MHEVRVIRIGRGQENDIVLSHHSISRNHLQVFINEEGTVFVTDLDSSNGTFINGNRLSGTAVLNPGDILRLGVEKPLKWRLWLNSAKKDGDIGKNQESIVDSSYPETKPGVRGFVYALIAAVILLAALAVFYYIYN